MPVEARQPEGLGDAYRVPKIIYYLWQANYATEPIVYIHPYDWTSRYAGQKRSITVNSNCDYVELCVNGVPKGKMYPTQENCHTVVFSDIVVEEGVITAFAEKDG